MAQKFEDVIARVEQIRHTVGLNKSRFSARVGMSPQTYNNFVGSQGSKPNIELIHGVVREFNVNPMWLLNGSGPTFRGYELEARSEKWSAAPGTSLDSDGNETEPNHSATLTRFKEDLDRLLQRSKGETKLWQGQDLTRDSQIRHAIQVLSHHFIVSPDETAIHVMNLLSELRRLVDEVELTRSVGTELRRAGRRDSIDA